MTKLFWIEVVAVAGTAALFFVPSSTGAYFTGRNYEPGPPDPSGTPASAADPREGRDPERASEPRARAAEVDVARRRFPEVLATPTGGGGDVLPVHSEESSYHRPESALHLETSDFHSPNSNTHNSESTVHYQSSDTHYYTSDYHVSNSDWHFPTSDFHVANTDLHYANTDVHLVESLLHTIDSDIHFWTTDTHTIDSTGHYNSSTQHTGSSTAHFSSTDNHQIGSALHTSSSGEGGNPGNCTDASPNWGDAIVQQSLLEVPFNLTCPTQLDVQHRIVTVNTPRTRDLYGNLRLNLVSGDPSCIEIRVGSQSGPIYSLGSDVQVVETGHSGCGIHTWHDGIQTFYVFAVKKGTVTLQAEVDPDPEPEGDGVPSQRTQVTIEAGMSSRGVTVGISGLIPCPAVINANPLEPYGCYGGDFNAQGNIIGARFFQSVSFTLDPDALPQANNRLLQLHSFGATNGHPAANCITGSSWYCLGLQTLLPPLATATLQPTPLNTAIVVDQVANGDFRSTHLLNATIPLDPLAPAINASLSVYLKECDGDLYYSILGTHDGFPAHLIWIDFTNVYGYDPRATGASPLNLAPPEDVFVNIPWTKL